MFVLFIILIEKINILPGGGTVMGIPAKRKKKIKQIIKKDNKEKKSVHCTFPKKM